MKRVGTRIQVMHGNAKQTGGGLKKKDLKYNKHGKIVSKKASANATKKMKGGQVGGGSFYLIFSTDLNQLSESYNNTTQKIKKKNRWNKINNNTTVFVGPIMDDRITIGWGPTRERESRRIVLNEILQRMYKITINNITYTDLYIKEDNNNDKSNLHHRTYKVSNNDGLNLYLKLRSDTKVDKMGQNIIIIKLDYIWHNNWHNNWKTLLGNFSDYKKPNNGVDIIELKDEINNIVVIGDIHGNWGGLIWNLVVLFLENNIIIKQNITSTSNNNDLFFTNHNTFWSNFIYDEEYDKYESIIEMNNTVIVFTGDIMDRGYFDIHCMFLILKLKVIFPNNIFISKGNHETIGTVNTYGWEWHKRTPLFKILEYFPRVNIIKHKDTVIQCQHGFYYNEKLNTNNTNTITNTKKTEKTDLGLYWSQWANVWGMDKKNTNRTNRQKPSRSNIEKQIKFLSSINNNKQKEVWIVRGHQHISSYPLKILMKDKYLSIPDETNIEEIELDSSIYWKGKIKSENIIHVLTTTCCGCDTAGGPSHGYIKYDTSSKIWNVYSVFNPIDPAKKPLRYGTLGNLRETERKQILPDRLYFPSNHNLYYHNNNLSNNMVSSEINLKKKILNKIQIPEYKNKNKKNEFITAQTNFYKFSYVGFMKLIPKGFGEMKYKDFDSQLIEEIYNNILNN